MFHVPEKYRITHGPRATDFTAGKNGAFELPPIIGARRIFIIASDGAGWLASGLNGEPWEHVSVHIFEGKKTKTPSWDEMAHVKDTFWDAEDVVIQFHPAKSNYVNLHPHVLHLWRPTKSILLTPPIETI